MNTENNNEIFNYSQKRTYLLDNLNKLKDYSQELELPKVTEVIKSNLNISSGFRVAIVGEFNRGKSTLINSLLGEKVLPADVRPCTATVNRITFGLKPAAKIIYKEKDGQPSYSETIEFDKLSDYVTKLTAGSKLTAADIEEALIEYNVNYLRDNIDIIDTPGINDAAEMTLVTLDLLDKAHAAIMVIAADSPVSEVEQDFIARLGGKNIGSVLFVVTRMDTIEEEEDRQKLLMEIDKRIREAIDKAADNLYEKGTKEHKNYTDTFGTPRLFVVSPNKGLKGKLSNNRALIEESGLRNFEDALKVFLTRDVGKVIIRSLAQLIINNSDRLLSQVQLKESAAAASIEEFNLVYDSSMRKLEELTKKYQVQMSRVNEAEEITRNNAVRILDSLEDRLISASTGVINVADITVSAINHKNLERTQEFLGKSIEKNLPDTLGSMLMEIEGVIGRELESASGRLQLFSEEVVKSINHIQQEFINISTRVASDESTNADIAKGAALSIFAVGVPVISGFYTGYKEAGLKGTAVGGFSGTVAGFGTALGLGMIAGALGLTIAAPIVIPVVIISSVVAAITGKHAARKVFGGDKVEQFKSQYKEESAKLLHEEISKLKPKLAFKVENSVTDNFQKLKDLVENEVGSLIYQTEETLRIASLKKTRSEAEISLEMNKLVQIKQTVLSSKNHAETTLGELQKIEGI